ncbi:MAG TPA: murein biosynthesis integral membrane protein MurJ [Terriglobia bacterium]|nr:murein biosynthesis integral membrane protein MurJ [Terriglobia bacterium]
MSRTEAINQATHDTSRSAFLVATGIFLSRLAGLVRERVFAHYFGNSAAADAFKAAFRIPNFLQNLFGEGVLSASFIPVYSALLARDEEEEANRLAGAIGTLLALSTSVLVLLGVSFTPYLIDAIAPGFNGEKRDLAIQLVRIFFPGSGLLVLSAWCLGILNSHRRFLLSYTAPVIWNVVIIIALVLYGGRTPQFPLAKVVAWSAVVGSGMQFLSQLPFVLQLTRHLNISFNWITSSVRVVISNFVPVFFSRGVIQISAYVDALLASLLPTGAVAALSYAQVLYTLPLSLFGMSVSAAELPTMSRALGSEAEIASQLRGRLNSSLYRVALFVVPSAVVFLAFGDVVSRAIYQSGQFTRADGVYVWGILAGSGVGLLASALGRIYASTYYALRDTRTPLKYAILRVLVTTGLGYVFALHLPGALGLDAKWGVAGLTTSAGIAGWLEFILLRRTLNQRIGQTGLDPMVLGKLWLAALVGVLAALPSRLILYSAHPVILGIGVLGLYGLVYFICAAALGIDEAKTILKGALQCLAR